MRALFNFLFGCGHNGAWPIYDRLRKRTYQRCVKCGAHRDYNIGEAPGPWLKSA